jgi:hypothetical protein
MVVLPTIKLTTAAITTRKALNTNGFRRFIDKKELLE